MAELGNGFVVLMGLGTVFFGLICIVLICMLMSLFFRGPEKTAASQTVNAPATVASGTAPIANRQETIAAISVAIAEQLGTDVSAIRIVSLKKL